MGGGVTLLHTFQGLSHWLRGQELSPGTKKRCPRGGLRPGSAFLGALPRHITSQPITACFQGSQQPRIHPETHGFPKGIHIY